MADAYHPKEGPYHLWTQYDLRQRSYWGFTLLPWQLSYHSNVVLSWCLSSQRSAIPNITLLRCRTKELLGFHFSCHGNWITIAMRYVTGAYCLKEPPYQIWTQYNLRQRHYQGLPLVAMATKFPCQQNKWLMPIIPRKVHTIYELNMT